MRIKLDWRRRLTLPLFTILVMKRLVYMVVLDAQEREQGAKGFIFQVKVVSKISDKIDLLLDIMV